MLWTGEGEASSRATPSPSNDREDIGRVPFQGEGLIFKDLLKESGSKEEVGLEGFGEESG